MGKKAMALMMSLAMIFSSGFGKVSFALDNTLCGYGQGREVNDENCPVGALMFNEQFYKYGAYAVTDSDKIVLTFDQGYENGFTAPILDTLKEKNVKAVFFLTGDYAKRNPELVKRMISEGHIIGNHGMAHASLPKLSDEEVREEIMSLHEYVSFAYCDWNTDDQPEVNSALERVTSAAHCGAIYLLHSVSETNCTILPRAIDNIRAAGFEFGLPEV